VYSSLLYTAYNLGCVQQAAVKGTNTLPLSPTLSNALTHCDTLQHKYTSRECWSKYTRKLSCMHIKALSYVYMQPPFIHMNPLQPPATHLNAATHLNTVRTTHGMHRNAFNIHTYTHIYLYICIFLTHTAKDTHTSKCSKSWICYTLTSMNPLQHTATHGDTRQHTVTHGETRQHTVQRIHKRRTHKVRYINTLQGTAAN